MPRILVVDDVVANRELIRAYLEPVGHEVIDAHSGEQALELTASAAPDLILLDVMLPGMNGFEVTRRIRETETALPLPIVLVTALDDPSSRLLGLRSGANEFLSKPVVAQELLVRVGNLIALREKDIELHRRNIALAELHRFREEMSALIVHDLKNPLAVILSNCAFAAEGLANAPVTYREALDDAQLAGRRLLGLLTRLLDMARLEANRLQLQRARVLVGRLLEEIVGPRRMMADSRGVTVEILADAGAELIADQDLFARALENIVDNSLRYAPQNGRIQAFVRKDASALTIRIGNSGPPIPLESRELIFEKFGQANGKSGRMNFGLGLYFCRLAIEAHGGTIRVEEEENLPTVFVIEVPISGAPSL